MKTPRIPVADEGYPFIFFCVFCTFTFALLKLAVPAFASLLLTAFVLYFFRDPVRTNGSGPDKMVSPADGKIILIQDVHDDRFVMDQVVKVSIFMNVFNVHVNRIPLAGTVEKVVFQPGRFYSADKDKAALHNEYCGLTIRTSDNIRYGVVQMAGLIARRIVCWAEKEDQVTTGQRYGLIRFGSRVDLYLPKSMTVHVVKGQKVVAGETVLATVPKGAPFSVPGESTGIA